MTYDEVFTILWDGISEAWDDAWEGFWDETGAAIKKFLRAFPWVPPAIHIERLAADLLDAGEKLLKTIAKLPLLAAQRLLIETWIRNVERSTGVVRIDDAVRAVIRTMDTAGKEVAGVGKSALLTRMGRKFKFIVNLIRRLRRLKAIGGWMLRLADWIERGFSEMTRAAAYLGFSITAAVFAVHFREQVELMALRQNKKRQHHTTIRGQQLNLRVPHK